MIPRAFTKSRTSHCYCKLRQLQVSKLYSTFALGSGPHGVDGRLPYYPFGSEVESRKKEDRPLDCQNPHISTSSDTGIAITDPFILYQNYINQGLLEKDELQLRVMKEFQKLYHRVVDYTPPEELSIKISLLLREIELKNAESAARELGARGKFSPLRFDAIHNLFRKDPEAEKKQLVKFITDEEELANFASPQGILIHGEVGCGKSMLMDIFAASLPHKLKMRWHYNNFILWVYSEMHKIQKQKVFMATITNGQGKQRMTMENEFILFEVAQKMINKNTVLMLDEFMLPDIASANIVKILFTYYFKLGGVLVATSNKLPEELYSNEFHKTKFKSFVAILNARCQTVDMRSDKDYRSVFASNSLKDPNLVIKEEDSDNHESNWLKLIKTKALGLLEDSEIVKNDDIKMDDPKLQGEPSSFTVYNRTTHLPLTFNSNTVCYLNFDYICQGLFSSSDYITLASNYKTIVLDKVPVLTTKMKNEARRFITLLDAIYEAKCQFFMRSDVPIDNLFFPDAVATKRDIDEAGENRLQVQDEEMFAKTAIAMSNPYRPNIASYDQEHTETYDEFTNSIKKAFVGDKTQNEDHDREADNRKIDFKNIKAFTGEDEKFAYKRAVLRIREMVGSEIWRSTNRWVPIDQSMRPWESVGGGDELYWGKRSINGQYIEEEVRQANEKMDELLKQKNSVTKSLQNDLPRNVSASHGIAFRQFNARIAPVFKNVQHFFGLNGWTTKWLRSKTRNDN